MKGTKLKLIVKNVILVDPKGPLTVDNVSGMCSSHGDYNYKIFLASDLDYKIYLKRYKNGGVDAYIRHKTS